MTLYLKQMMELAPSSRLVVARRAGQVSCRHGGSGGMGSDGAKVSMRSFNFGSGMLGLNSRKLRIGHGRANKAKGDVPPCFAHLGVQGTAHA